MNKKMNQKIKRKISKIARMKPKELIDYVQYLEALHTAAGTLLALEVGDRKCEHCEEDLSAKGVVEALVSGFKVNLERNVEMNCALNKIDFGGDSSTVNKELAEEILAEIEAEATQH